MPIFIPVEEPGRVQQREASQEFRIHNYTSINTPFTQTKGYSHDCIAPVRIPKQDINLLIFPQQDSRQKRPTPIPSARTPAIQQSINSPSNRKPPGIKGIRQTDLNNQTQFFTNVKDTLNTFRIYPSPRLTFDSGVLRSNYKINRIFYSSNPVRSFSHHS